MHDPDKLDRAALDDLVEDEALLEEFWLLLVIGLEAPNVVKVAGGQGAEEGLEVSSVLPADRSEGSLLLVLFPQALHEAVLGATDQVLAFRKQAVIVLVQPALRRILHSTRIVLDYEAFVRCRGSAGPTLARHVQPLQHLISLGILRRLLDNLLTEFLVCVTPGFHALSQTGTEVIQCLEDLADAKDHRLGVWQCQVRPRETLSPIQSLLRREHVLHEVLLQPLVRQIDAELFERVLLQPLEAVDVQDANLLSRSCIRLRLHRGSQLAEGVIDALHDSLEEPLVEGLDEALEGLAELRWSPGHLVERHAAWNPDLSPLQCPDELVCVHPEQLGCLLGALFVEVHCLSPREGLLFLLGGPQLGTAVRLLQHDIPEVDDAGQHPQARIDLLLIEADRLQGVSKPPEVAHVAFLEAPDAGAMAGGEAVIPSTLQLQITQLLVAQAGKHLVEDMVRPLICAVHHHARTLQEVCRNASVDESALSVEADPVVLAKTR
mmetsp:Transcript_69686/g.151641  ORF Transcript_69686/g.151641 Transcript_69686/m.151641 type:complete len:492 (-) Transcript_69686:675-2150(-)